MKLIDIVYRFILFEQDSNISDAILKVRDKYKKEYIPLSVKRLDNEYQDVNTGWCEDLAYEVKEQLPTLNMQILNDGIFWDSDESMNSDKWIKINSENKLNISSMERYNSPNPVSKFSKNYEFPGHTWLYYNKLHFDAEVPYGVKSFWELPIFKRSLQGNK